MANSIRRRVARIALVFLAAVALAPATRAQETYPAKPVHLLIPFPPGGAVDIVGRTVADELGKHWPANIIVDNRPGAGGTIAAEALAKAAPDGYTIAVVASGHAIVPYLFRKLPYDVFADFTPLTLLGTSPNLALVRGDSPIRTVADLISAAREKPGQLSYGHSGNGTSAHLAAELFKAMAKVDIVSVPYKGGVPALNDLLGGHIPISFNNLPESLAMIRSGAVRALAVTTAKRTPLLPDVPTFHELGLAGLEELPYYGLFAPAGTPQAVLDRYNQALAKVIAMPEVRDQLTAMGLTVAYQPQAPFTQRVKSYTATWDKIIKASGFTPK